MLPETSEPTPQNESEYRRAFQRIKQTNKRLTRELTKLQTEIKERCQSYMAEIGRLKAGKQQLKPLSRQLLSLQTGLLDVKLVPDSHRLEVSGSVSQDISRLDTLTEISTNPNRSTCVASVQKDERSASPSVDVVRIQEDVNNYKKKYDQQLQEVRRSRDSNRLSSCSADSAAPIQETITVEELRYQFEEEKRKTDEKIYVYEAIFTHIHNILMEDEKGISDAVEEIRKGKYDTLKDKLYTMFNLIKINKENSLLIGREKQELLKQIQYLSSRTKNMKEEIERKLEEQQKNKKTIKIDGIVQTEEQFQRQIDEPTSPSHKRMVNSTYQLYIPSTSSSSDIVNRLYQLTELQIDKKYAEIRQMKEKLSLTIAQMAKRKSSSEPSLVSIQKLTIEEDNQKGFDDGYTKRSFIRKKIVKKVVKKVDEVEQQKTHQISQSPCLSNKQSIVTNFPLQETSKTYSRFITDSSPYKKLQMQSIVDQH